MQDTTINPVESEQLPSSDTALELMMTFARRFGVAHTTLAMHAALPLGLSPEIVHLIRINFVPAAPWIAEADLLLSPLCRELGGDLYEMDAQVRELLLDELNGSWRFGPARLKALAEFMLAYVSSARVQTRDGVTLDFLRAQEMVALAYAHPEAAAQRIALALRLGIDASDRDETLRMASLAQMLSAPLFAEGKVLIYAAGVEKLFDRELDKAMRLFGSIGAATQATTIGGVTLPAAAEMAEQRKLTEPAPAAPAPFPLGFALRATLRGHTRTINRLAWSPDGKQLASPATDGTVIVWNAEDWDFRRLEMVDRKGGSSEDEIRQVAWSTYEDRLALISARGAVHIYESLEVAWSTYGTLERPQYNQGHCLAWSPDGSRLVWGTENSLVWLDTSDVLDRDATLLATRQSVTHAVAWSPHGNTLVATAGIAVDLWDDLAGRPHNLSVNLQSDITALAWSPNGYSIAAGAASGEITITDKSQAGDGITLRGHRGYITGLAFSFDGRLLASKSVDGTVRLWRCDRWEQVAMLDEPYPDEGVWSGLAFHPTEPLLATLDGSGTAIRIWELNVKALLGPESAPSSITYKNAKVMLLGEPGIGKTALSLALTGQSPTPTDVPPGLAIRSFGLQAVRSGDGSKEVREVLLWNPEWGPNERLANQLHFDDIAVALIVFNTVEPTLETEVQFWDQALQQARRAGGNPNSSLKKLLVSYRQNQRLRPEDFGLIDRLCKAYAIEGFYEVVANNSYSLMKLADTIRNAVRWEERPSLSVPEPARPENVGNITPTTEEAISAVGRAKEAVGKLLNDEFGAYQPLFSREELRSAVEKRFADLVPPDELNARFDSGVRLAQTLGLLKRLNQGRDFLLSSDHATRTVTEMIREALKDAQGLCSFDEAEFRAQRPQGEGHEITAYYAALDQQLVGLVSDELILRELAFRVRVDGKSYLVFPSLLNFDSLPEPQEIGPLVHAIYTVNGPLTAIYATLLTRLTKGQDFALKAVRTTGAIFSRKSSRPDPARPNTRQAEIAIMLKTISETQSQFTILFESGVDDATRFLFEETIRAHLFGWSPQAHVTRQRTFACQKCHTVFDSQAVNILLRQGQDTVQCPVCGTTNSLFDRAEAMAAALESILPESPQQANAWQEHERVVAELERKLAAGVFDVALSYHVEDKSPVTNIAQRLLKRGILPWFDVWEGHHQETAQEALRQQVGRIESVALFAGSNGYRVSETTTYPAIQGVFHIGLPEVPVILSGGQGPMSFPASAAKVALIDFRISDPNPIDELIRAISTPPASPRPAPPQKTPRPGRPAAKHAPRPSPAKKRAPAKKSTAKSSLKRVPKKK